MSRYCVATKGARSPARVTLRNVHFNDMETTLLRADDTYRNNVPVEKHWPFVSPIAPSGHYVRMVFIGRVRPATMPQLRHQKRGRGGAASKQRKTPMNSRGNKMIPWRGSVPASHPNHNSARAKTRTHPLGAKRSAARVSVAVAAARARLSAGGLSLLWRCSATALGTHSMLYVLLRTTRMCCIIPA